MDFYEKKQRVFQLLKQQQKPIGLVELLQMLGEEFSERSVRRWLAGFVEQGWVRKAGKARATKYRAVSLAKADIYTLTAEQPKAKYHTHDVFSAKTQQSIEQKIFKPVFSRKPVSYNFSWFNSYKPNQTYYLSPGMLSTMQQRGVRGMSNHPPGSYAQKIYRKLLIDLCFNSSRLEGSAYSKPDAEKLLINGIANKEKSDLDRVIILNHQDAIKYLVENSHKIEINFNQVCTLHYLLADSLLQPKYTGRMRDHAIRASSSAYIALDGVEKLQSQLEQVCLKASKINNPLEQSFFLLVHVAYLQAFCDVNKRTARLSANIALIKNDLVPLVFKLIDPEDYALAMIAIYELNDVQPLAELFYFSYLQTCEDYDVTAEAIGYDEIRVRYRVERRELIRLVVREKVVGALMEEFIEKQSGVLIPEQDRNAFMKEVNKDLASLSSQIINGLGVTQQEFDAWIAVKK